jgi:hypothetical protein
MGGFDALWDHALDFMTRGANLNIAHLAPPLSAQETIAVGSGTWLDKLAGWFRRLLARSLAISKLPHASFCAINFILNNAHLIAHFCPQSAQLPCNNYLIIKLLHILCVSHCLLHATQFMLE